MELAWNRGGLPSRSLLRDGLTPSAPSLPPPLQVLDLKVGLTTKQALLLQLR